MSNFLILLNCLPGVVAAAAGAAVRAVDVPEEGEDKRREGVDLSRAPARRKTDWGEVSLLQFQTSPITQESVMARADRK